MAYQMKSSPAKLMGALKIGSKILKYGKKAFTKKPKTRKINTPVEDPNVTDLMNKFKQQFKDPVKK